MERYKWTMKQEVDLVKDWQKSDSIGELVDLYWNHPAFEDLEPQTDAEEEKARLTIATRLQNKAKSIQLRGVRMKTFARTRIVTANELDTKSLNAILKIKSIFYRTKNKQHF